MSLLKETIKEDYIKARKANDLSYKILSLLLAAIKQEEVDTRKELKDADILKILKTEKKKRKEAITEFQKGQREDLIKKEKEELDIINKYLPQEMSEKDILDIVKKTINELNAEPKDMGKVIGKIMNDPEVKAKADGNLVSKIVKEELNK